MNITSLKTGMLVRDNDKLLEVVDVRDDSATAEVCLEGLEAPEYKWRINYSEEGVYSFLKEPTDEQMEAIVAVREGKSYVRQMVSDLRKKSDYVIASSIVTDQMIMDCFGLDEYADLTDDEGGDTLILRTGDPITWKRYSHFRVNGWFVREVRGYIIALTQMGKCVALQRSNVTREDW